ncbi:CDP-diglyceride synthetase [Runella defluvii]|uniref:CDP-diglyceride synthetase n=1 Tax=Runella defluvii TaxID=370973 RepID=A0A7W5ZM75_9BACT|nr:CDP-diglyceride synthetase [Runella defluvii]
MLQDKYKTITILTLISLFVLVILLKQYWFLPLFATISIYTYYKRLQVIPKEDRLKAITPTIIGISLIFIFLVIFWNMA